jgi:hypothetical protein
VRLSRVPAAKVADSVVASGVVDLGKGEEDNKDIELT